MKSLGKYAKLAIGFLGAVALGAATIATFGATGIIAGGVGGAFQAAGSWIAGAASTAWSSLSSFIPKAGETLWSGANSIANSTGLSGVGANIAAGTGLAVATGATAAIAKKGIIDPVMNKIASAEERAEEAHKQAAKYDYILSEKYKGRDNMAAQHFNEIGAENENWRQEIANYRNGGMIR